VAREGGALAIVVEPEAELRGALCAALEAVGVHALPAETAREALATLDRVPASVLLIDAELPDMGGFDLARSVRRQLGSTVSLFILTDVSWGPAQRSAAVHQMGLSDILVRPIAAESVAEIVLRSAGALRTSPSRPAVALRRREAAPSGELADSATHREQREVERAAASALAGSPPSAQQPDEVRGNLGVTPFPVLLHSLYRRRASGALFLLRDTVKKIVYFRDGHPSYIKSNLLSECLGKVLVREGMITEAQCRDSLKLMKQSQRQQGTVLIEMGIISPQNLVVGLELQLRAKLLDIFGWLRGEYLFKADARVPAEVIQLDVSSATLIADGIRSAWDAARLEEALAPSWDRHLAPAADPELRFQELSLAEEEQALLDAVDGVRTARQLAAESALPRARALAVTYALLATGVVEARATPSPVESDTEVRPHGAWEEPLRAQLAAQLVSLRQRDAYGVLGVPATASDPAIEQAYSSLAREYHPDRFRHAPPETRQLADEIFGLIFHAYRAIGSVEKRHEYSVRLSTAELDLVSPSGSTSLAAERIREQALGMMGEGRHAEAADRLMRALELRPEAADLRALYGWALWSAAPADAEAASRAIRELRRAIELDPKSYQAHLALGRIYAQMGKAILAEKQLEKALQCQPTSEEALAELLAQRKRRPPRRR
jgi:DNA-binding response OmpR family regulator/curved DNA-binding protein CbpA